MGNKKRPTKDKCAPYPYLFNCLSPTIQTRLGENLAAAAAAQASGRAACARPGGAACARGGRAARRLRGAGACGRAAREAAWGRRLRVSGVARARGAGACARPLGRRSCHGRASPRLRRQAGCAMEPEIDGCTATMELVSRYEISTKCRTNVGGINLGI